MSTPSFALSAPTDGKSATNPMGLSRIDHFQLTGSIERLEPLYRRLGFARVASGTHPWGRLVHLRQQRMDMNFMGCSYCRGRGERPGPCRADWRRGGLDRNSRDGR